MFETLLIANRGEIACRVIKTARKLGIRTVAVYSEADRDAWHVALADEAHEIGPAPAAESYLSIPAILAAAEASGAQAIHPGYGFLSENADFAEACEKAGLVFVGPPPAAIRAMGSKREAKTIMEKAGVPLVPGYHGADQDEKTLAQAAKKIGYPVLIKASAGGGGKGMRVVEKAADFTEALAGARREAKAGFGDDTVLIERYLTRPRHIEIQVFADGHGNQVHVFERDCSIQRRHQKVVEEAPAPGMTEARRAAMGDAALAAAAAIGYRGAGTVEFIAEGEDFYFMEMNTRLQVEHPVTEMITGQDLVAWQLRVAAGEPLPLTQDRLKIRGHAIETRIYAEDPARGFLPATGRLSHLRFPGEGRQVRVDSGVRGGDEIGPHYDPMIAKLVVWDEDRPAAVRRLRRALEETEALGLTTNLAFLAALAAHPAFGAAELDTGFLDRHGAALTETPDRPDDEVLALASLAVLEQRRAEAAAHARESGDPYSPWHQVTGWRLTVGSHVVLRFQGPESLVAVTVWYLPEGYRLGLPGGAVEARATLDEDGGLDAVIDGRRLAATIVREGSGLALARGPRSHVLALHDPLLLDDAAGSLGGRLVAPMPGKVVQVKVSPGETVAGGAPLMVLEAMKMEHTIAAPSAGRVGAVLAAAGELVEEGAELVVLESVE